MQLGKFLKNAGRKAGRFLHIPLGKSAVMISAAMCIVIVFTWLLMLIMPYGWMDNSDIFYRFQISTYSIKTDRNEYATKEDQVHEATRLSNLFDALNERNAIWFSVATFGFCRDESDSRSVMWCKFMHQLMWSSATLQVSAFFGVANLLMGAMAGCYYHFVKRREELIKWTAGYMVLAPVCFTYGLWQYWYYNKDFSKLIGNSDSSFSIAFYGSFLATFATLIAAWIMLAFGFSATENWEEVEEAPLFDEEEDDPEDGDGSYGAMWQDFKDSVVDGVVESVADRLNTAAAERLEKVADRLNIDTLNIDTSSASPELSGALLEEGQAHRSTEPAGWSTEPATNPFSEEGRPAFDKARTQPALSLPSAGPSRRKG